MIKRPSRLDIVDMPRDSQRALGSLRQVLCATFNYCRKYPLKMQTLKTVLEYTLERINALESASEAPVAKEEAPKATKAPAKRKTTNKDAE